tara:strand:- start:6636 stop:6965 length:330 start_codon:yes stop_codon:yes gene_type:complete
MEQFDASNPYQQPQTITTAPPQQPNQTLAIVSLVLAILSLPGWCCMLYLPLSIAAIITGIIALQKINAGTGGGKGMAMAGVITGGIILVLFTIVYAILIYIEINNSGTF